MVWVGRKEEDSTSLSISVGHCLEAGLADEPGFSGIAPLGHVPRATVYGLRF